VIYEAFISAVFFFLKTAPLILFLYLIIWYIYQKNYMLKILDRLNSIAKLMKLNPIAFTSFTLSFVSIIASYTFLSQAWRDRSVKDREVIGISLLNSFPSTFNHLYTFYIPFVIPLLGYVGFIYTLIRIGVALIKTIVGYFLIEKSSKFKSEEIDSKLNIELAENVGKILIILFLSYFAIELMYEVGLFEFIVEQTKFLPIHPSALTISLVAIFNMRSAVVITAGFIEKGLNYKWALAGLILGNVISFSVRFARHSLPLHLSLFGRLGFKIVLVNSIMTLALDFLVLVIIVITL